MEPILRARRDPERRGRRIPKPEASSAHRIVEALEREAHKRLGQVLQRLEIPSRGDVDSLSRRIAQLERRLHSHEGADVGPASASAAGAVPAGMHSSCAACGAVFDSSTLPSHACVPASALDAVQFAELFWDEV